MNRELRWTVLIGLPGATGVGLLLTNAARDQALVILTFICVVALLIITAAKD
jgi:hypothetical protein